MSSIISEKQEQSEPTKKTVYSRIDYSWFLAGTYLDIMHGIGYIFSDDEFNRLFGELRDYVDKKLTMPCVGDINDYFVVAEQIVPADKFK